MTTPVEDVLGAPFSAQTLNLRPDDEGPVVATLVRRTPIGRHRRAVLYLHGFVDYFFHVHVAQEWVDHGYDFYALDLRKYGRSIRAHQTVNDVTDLADYDEEIDEAVRIIREEGHDVVVLLAHSTGGLIAPLWAHRRRGLHLIDAMVLNSPFFDLNGTALERGLLTRVIDVAGRFLPRLVVSSLASAYAQALHTTNGGEWDFDTSWKSIAESPVRAGWLRAVRRGQKRLNAGLAIDVPVLVITSARSGDGRTPGPHHRDSDCVLDVEHMWRGARVIGPEVTVVTVEGGLHDLSLSPTAVRNRFFREVFDWTATHVPDVQRLRPV
ncbi:alpha/beta hydrolase [Nakamurella deserti]|uniref:alpha/beta hydrolase n=1 Tax=Nakamurella deserti TaxID=2164074 RepID=UPI00197B3F10|nr:alpha/beta hydrolase [Nakamurella deserti]